MVIKDSVIWGQKIGNGPLKAGSHNMRLLYYEGYPGTGTRVKEVTDWDQIPRLRAHARKHRVSESCKKHERDVLKFLFTLFFYAPGLTLEFLEHDVLKLNHIHYKSNPQ